MKSYSKDHPFSNQANEPFNHLSSAAEILGEMKNPFAKFNCSLIFLTSEYLVFYRLDFFLHEMKNSLLKYSVTERVMGVLCSGDWAS